MPKIRRQEFPTFRKERREFRRFLKTAPTLIGNVALNFYQDSWNRQGFLDRRVEKWKPRAVSDKRRGSRKLLVKTGKLRRSLRMKTSGYRIQIYTDIPYAQIHNEGGRITGTVRVRQHTRRTRSGRVTVRKHTRRVNTRIPKRQFMGPSQTLDKRIEWHLTKSLDQILG